MPRSVSVITSVLLAALALRAAPATADRIYWADTGAGLEETIQRASLDGSGIETIVTQRDAPISIALDLPAGKVYWTTEHSNVQRANLDGTGVEHLARADRSPYAIALDLTRGKMYLGGGDGIWWANLDGTEFEELISTGSVYGIALDLADERVYWCRASVYRARLDGSNVERIVHMGSEETGGMALDLGRRKVYWPGVGTGTIRRAGFDGTNVEEVVTGLLAPKGIALDLARGKIYWTEFGEGAIYRANLDGTRIERVVRMGPFITSIALDLECGNGIIDPGEACDIGIPAGEPGSCPTSCGDRDSCTRDVVADPPSCTAPCEFIPITTPTDDDGCCPRGGHVDIDNDCTFLFVPTLSDWGLVVLTLLLLIGAKLCFGRRFQAV